MQREQKIYRALRRRLLARVSVLALRAALRPPGWASGLLMAGLMGAPASALAQETLLTTDAELIIQGGAPYDQSGNSVSGAGDVNGDGFDDLIIGAFAASPNGRTNAGASYVIFGSDQGLPAVIDLANDADLIVQGAAEGDFSGNSVSGVGDVNGDGIDDLIVGAPNADPEDRTYAGASFVVLGASDLSGTIDLADPVNGADLIIQGAATYDFSGSSVSGAGDVNGDGIDDLIVGAPSADPNDREYAGASYVVFGATDLSSTIDLADPMNGADLIIEGAASQDQSGFSVSWAGDVDGDEIDDLIIGAIGASPNGRDSAGASYVVLGTTDLAGTIDLADPMNGADLIIQGAAIADLSGWSVSGAGDVNGDHVDDLIIGAPNPDPNGRNLAGASYVVFGDAHGLPSAIDLATEADVIIQGAAANDESGRSVSGAGDITGDGIDDLIIGAPFADPDGQDFAGTSYVVFGARDLAGTIDLADPVNGADLIIQGAATFDLSGFSVSGAGDVNGDRDDDVIVGALAASPDAAGASYVVFGGPAAAIERLIASVEAADLEPGVERILTKTLSKALDNVNKGKERRAIVALRLFIIEVKALRGKRIPEAVADAWIADAETIIDTLKAQRDRHRGPHHDAPSPMVEAQQ